MPEPGEGGSHDREVSPGTLLDLIAGAWRSQAVCVAAELGIADTLKDGPRSTQEVARALNASEDAVYRLLRALSSLGLFSSLPDHRFTLTPLGAYLREDVGGSLRSYARFVGHDVTRRPWGNLTYSVRTGKPAADYVFGTGIFDYLAKHPDVAAVVNAAMTAITATDAPAVVEAYDFSGIATLVDVGGGHGLLLASILKANSHMRGILFELPHAVDGGTSLLSRERLADRCAVMSGDFFEMVPEGGDAYIIKRVIHDWDNTRARRILENCHQAMRAGGRLLVVERLVLPGDDPDIGKLLDLQMLVLTGGGRERTEAEFRELYYAAGFELTRIIPTKGPAHVIEGIRR